jgi:predicted anti-sigma-YlaC factor YlaD
MGFSSGNTFRAATNHRWTGVLIVVPLLLAGSGCSIKRMAVNKLGDALAGNSAVFASDNDPELIKQAAPFSLKLMESLLAQSPRHRGLLLATASGFTQYAYAFIQMEADELEATNLAAAEALRGRARRLFIRARDYGLRGLDSAHAGFSGHLLKDAHAAVGKLEKRDVALAYWTGASWAAAIALSKDNPDLVADLPRVEALMDRALVLDESFQMGALHGFMITYEMTRTSLRGDPAERSRKHFERVVQLSGGRIAAPFVSLAESVALKQQNRAEFKKLLDQALAIDPDADPSTRLLNLVVQRRARWLLTQIDDLFVEPEGETKIKP